MRSIQLTPSRSEPAVPRSAADPVRELVRAQDAIGVRLREKCRRSCRASRNKSASVPASPIPWEWTNPIQLELQGQKKIPDFPILPILPTCGKFCRRLTAPQPLRIMSAQSRPTSPGGGVAGTANVPKIKLFSGRANRPLAEHVAMHLGVALGRLIVSDFPDGETNVRIDEDVR